MTTTQQTNAEEQLERSLNELWQMIGELSVYTLMTSKRKSEIAMVMRNAATHADGTAEELSESANQFRDNSQHEIDQVLRTSHTMHQTAERMRQAADKMLQTPTIPSGQ